jgi:hypothetical protein
MDCFVASLLAMTRFILKQKRASTTARHCEEDFSPTKQSMAEAWTNTLMVRSGAAASRNMKASSIRSIKFFGTPHGNIH